MCSNYYKDLFSNLCCSVCKTEFNESAFTVVRREKELKVIKLICPECGKDYGICFLKAHPNVGQPHEALKI